MSQILFGRGSFTFDALHRSLATFRLRQQPSNLACREPTGLFSFHLKTFLLHFGQNGHLR